MCVGVLPAFVSVPFAYPVPVKKRELDALELELQTFVSHNVGARNSTQVPLEEQPVSLTAETSLQTLFSETKFVPKPSWLQTHNFPSSTFHVLG